MKTNKKQILDKIDDLIIHEKDYDTLSILLNIADERFFVKVMEEILDGNLFIQDFERWFSRDESYENILEQNLRTQLKLKTEIQRLIDYRKNILGEIYSAEDISKSMALIKPLDDENYKDLYYEQDKYIKEDTIYQLLTIKSEDNELIKTAKTKIMKAYKNNEITRDDILLFADNHIIPISYEHQVINSVDNEFMYENNLTEDEMKKIKALAIFFRRDKVGG